MLCHLPVASHNAKCSVFGKSAKLIDPHPGGGTTGAGMALVACPVPCAVPIEGLMMVSVRKQRIPRCFPIQLDVQYQCAEARVIRGVGKTIDIGSHELRFTTQHSLYRGQHITLGLDWPILLDETCPLKLHISGSIVGEDSGAASLQIKSYEFRTRRSGPALMLL